LRQTVRELGGQPGRLTIAFRGGPEYIAGRGKFDDGNSGEELKSTTLKEPT